MISLKRVWLGCAWSLLCGATLAAAAQAADSDKKTKKSKDDKSGKSGKAGKSGKESKDDSKGAASEAKTFDEAIAEGEARFAELDHPGTLKSYEKAVKLAKTDEEKNKAYTGLSSAYNNNGKQKEAVDASLEAVRYPPATNGTEASEVIRLKYINDTYSEAFRIAQAVMKDWPLAHKICLQALETQEFQAKQRLEWSLRNMKMYAEEVDAKNVDVWLGKSIAIDKILPKDKFDAYRQAAFCYSHVMGYHKGNKDEARHAKARDYYNLALNVPSANLTTSEQGEMLHRIGESYRWVGRYSQGREYQAKVLALTPEPNTNVIFNATMETGRCFKAEGDKTNARKWFEDALAIADKSHNESFRASCDRELKDL